MSDTAAESNTHTLRRLSVSHSAVQLLICQKPSEPSLELIFKLDQHRNTRLFIPFNALGSWKQLLHQFCLTALLNKYVSLTDLGLTAGLHHGLETIEHYVDDRARVELDEAVHCFACGSLHYDVDGAAFDVVAGEV